MGAPLKPASLPEILALPQITSRAAPRRRHHHLSHRSARPTRSEATTDVQPQPLPPASAAADADAAEQVKFLHLASPYVVGHRGRTFVLVIPGDVVADRAALLPLLEDVVLLHGLGVRLVLVVGVRADVDARLRARGLQPRWEGGYRVTDAAALEAAVEATGAAAAAVAAAMSRAPSVGVVRRHTRSDGAPGGANGGGGGGGGGGGQTNAYAPPVQVVTGNFVQAKRRGIVGGVDFGYGGAVRSVHRAAVLDQLEAGAVVVLGPIGVSAPTGELLNCNCWDVALGAAAGLGADKLLCLTGADVRALGLPQYLPLDDAEAMIAARSGAPAAVLGADGGSADGGVDDGADAAPEAHAALDLDAWHATGLPPALLAAVAACRRGVRRAHLIDAAVDGALLLELYTRDGIEGVCMLAADLYEGIRPARAGDAPDVAALLGALAGAGVGLPPEVAAAAGGGNAGAAALAALLPAVTVVEREGKALGAAAALDRGAAPDGARVAELGALVVAPGLRRRGLGDSLLDWCEQDLRGRGFRRLVLVAGEGFAAGEWFAARGFAPLGGGAAADAAAALPPMPALPAVCTVYAKPLLDLDEAARGRAPGKRIGF